MLLSGHWKLPSRVSAFPALTPPVGHCPEEGRGCQSTRSCCSLSATTSDAFKVLSLTSSSLEQGPPSFARSSKRLSTRPLSRSRRRLASLRLPSQHRPSSTNGARRSSSLRPPTAPRRASESQQTGRCARGRRNGRCRATRADRAARWCTTGISRRPTLSLPSRQPVISPRLDDSSMGSSFTSLTSGNEAR